MAVDASGFIAQWGVVVDSFNRGDLAPLTEQLAPDCMWLSSAGPVGNSRDEILQAVKSARDAGWSGHRVLGLVGGGEFVVGIYRNDYADGSSHIAGAVLRINEGGKVSEIRSLEPAAVVAATQG
jgi:hypothetical protein